MSSFKFSKLPPGVTQEEAEKEMLRIKDSLESIQTFLKNRCIKLENKMKTDPNNEARNKRYVKFRNEEIAFDYLIISVTALSKELYEIEKVLSELLKEAGLSLSTPPIKKPPVLN